MNNNKIIKTRGRFCFLSSWMCLGLTTCMKHSSMEIFWPCRFRYSFQLTLCTGLSYPRCVELCSSRACLLQCCLESWYSLGWIHQEREGQHRAARRAWNGMVQRLKYTTRESFCLADFIRDTAHGQTAALSSQWKALEVLDYQVESKNQNALHWYHFNCTLDPLEQQGQMAGLQPARGKLLQEEFLVSTKPWPDNGSSDFGWYNLESVAYSGTALRTEWGPVLHIPPLPWNHRFTALQNHIGWKRAPRP